MILIVDDHAMMRNGLSSWLEKNTRWKDIRLADSVSAAKAVMSSALPEICIIDVQIGEEDGFSLLDFITKEYPAVKCVMYSMFDSPGYVSQARMLGAKGYVSKASSEEELVKCLEAVSRGDSFIEEKMENSFERIEEIVRFMTKTERRIFHEILKGKTNSQITEMLNISNHRISFFLDISSVFFISASYFNV